MKRYICKEIDSVIIFIAKYALDSTQGYNAFKLMKTTNGNKTAHHDKLISVGSERSSLYLSDDVDNRTPSFSSTNINTTFRCPEQFGYFADTIDCSRYYVCVFGDPLHETCTGGLYFSFELQTCDWPQNVDCVHHHQGQDDIRYAGKKFVELNKTKTVDRAQPNKQSQSFDEANTEPPMADYSSNDLDNPEFDESIASFVDQNGEVYVHDGPGGLYSLMERSSAISDHDRRIFGISSPSAVNSLQKKSLDKPIKVMDKLNTYRELQSYGKHRLCDHNCTKSTENRNIHFDDDSNESVDSSPLTALSDHLTVYPEHLRPRLKIVKKQLKDYDDEELLNQVEKSEDQQDDQEKNDKLSGRDVTNDKEKTANNQETITFVADTSNDDYLRKRDLWNYDGNSKSSLTKPAIRIGSTVMLNTDTDLAKIHKIKTDRIQSNDYNRYSKHGSHHSNNSYKRLSNAFNNDRPAWLTEDSIMQVFRGQKPSAKPVNYTTNNRRYLLQSFTIPLYSIHSNLAKLSTSPTKSDRLVNRFSPNSTKESKDSQIIFYSYRNQAQKSAQNGRNSRLINYTPASVEITAPIPNKDELEVFTMRPIDLLAKNNSFSLPVADRKTKSKINVTSTVYEYRSTGPNRFNLNKNKHKPTPHFQNLYINHSKLVYDDTLDNIRTMTTTESPSFTQTTQANYTKIDSTNYIYQPNEKQQPQHCDSKLNCKLPKCFCPGTKAPNNVKRKEIPQMILLTFDDAVNDVNFPLYQEIFEPIKRVNPNGCPIKGTFFVSHEWTDYGKVQTLYSRGHEIASHSITHSFGEKFTTQDWYREIVGQKEILHRYGGIPREEIRGMRAPFLQIGGDQQFQMLMDANLTYDSSISIFDNAPPFWPYTLDFAIQHDCMISPCPTRSYPGLWEIGLIMWHDLVGGGRCTMGNSCTSPPDEKGVYELIMSNFKRHYETNRAPFGLFYQSGWFTTPHHLAGFLRFINDVLKLGDVYFVTNWQLLQWMQNPTSLDRIDQFVPWQCHNSHQHAKSSDCLMPNICHVKFRKKSSIGSRYFKTCQKCPTDYPWIDNVDQLLIR